MTALRSLKLPIKTALAAALSYVAYRTFNLPHGYWAPISAVIVMQSNLGRSLSESANRLIGTAIGAALGAVFTRLLGLNALALFVAVAVTAITCILVRLATSMRLACVTAAIVLLINEGSPWLSGWNRFIDVALGVVLALAVSLVWPARARDDLRQSLASTMRELQTFFSAVMSCSLGDPCDTSAIDAQKSRIYQLARANNDLLADVDRERTEGGMLLASIQQSITRMRDHLLGMDYSARQMARDSFHHPLIPRLRDLASAIDHAFTHIAHDIADTATPTAHLALEEPLARLDEDFTALRASGAARQHESEELLRFYSLFYRLRQLGAELTRCAEFANALDHSTHLSAGFEVNAGYNQRTP